VRASPSTPEHCEAPARTATSRFRAEIAAAEGRRALVAPSHPPNSVTLNYDARFAPHCSSSPAATLLFLWYEEIFKAAGYPPGGIQRVSLHDWREPLGFSAAVPRRWFQTFYQIGTIIHGHRLYAAAVLARREFWSRLKRRYVFYCMEVNSNHTDATLHRNADLINAETNFWSGPPAAVLPKAGDCVQGRRSAAATAASRVQRAIEGRRDTNGTA
jgi:hypothetical protein